MTDCFTLLLNLDMLNAAVCPFTNVAGGGFAGWFYVFIILALEVGIYVKTRNLLIPSVLGMFISGGILSSGGALIGMDVMPGYFFLAAFSIFVINMTIILYGIFKSMR